MKSEVIPVRASHEQKARWLAAAGKQSLSGWIRDTLDEAAKPPLLVLGDDARNRLLDRLAPPTERAQPPSTEPLTAEAGAGVDEGGTLRGSEVAITPVSYAGDAGSTPAPAIDDTGPGEASHGQEGAGLRAAAPEIADPFGLRKED